jgi:hypothetical protein
MNGQYTEIKPDASSINRWRGRRRHGARPEPVLPLRPAVDHEETTDFVGDSGPPLLDPRVKEIRSICDDVQTLACCPIVPENHPADPRTVGDGSATMSRPCPRARGEERRCLDVREFSGPKGFPERA